MGSNENAMIVIILLGAMALKVFFIGSKCYVLQILDSIWQRYSESESNFKCLCFRKMVCCRQHTAKRTPRVLTHGRPNKVTRVIKMLIMWKSLKCIPHNVYIKNTLGFPKRVVGTVKTKIPRHIFHPFSPLRGAIVYVDAPRPYP